MTWTYSRMTSSNGNIFRVPGHLCGEFAGYPEFSTQKPVTRSFYVFFDLRLNKRLSKQSWGWWFETPSRPSWRHCNACESQRYQFCFCCVMNASDGENFLTHWDRDKMATISQTIFSNRFSWENCLIFDQNFTEVCSHGSNWQYPSISSDNGLAPARRQAIIRTNDG